MSKDYSPEQFNRLEERARNLAQEKSHLQLIVKMMNRLGEMPGLENTVNTLIQLMLESIGGSNATIYYWIDDIIFKSDINQKNCIIEKIDDEDVKIVIEKKEFLELESDFEHTKLMTNQFTLAYTWVCPLLTANQLIGVIKINDLHVTSHEFKSELQTFFNYAALVIKNEILGHTRLQKAFEQVGESEKHFHSLFDNMNEGVALHELEFLDGKPYDYRIIDINPQFEKILVLSREQIVDKLSTVAYGTETPPYFNEYVDVTINKKPLFFETYFADLDKYFAISVVPWQENGFATIFTDISERKNNEEKLYKLSTAVEQSPATVIITDINGGIEYVNPKFTSITGYSFDEVISKNPRILKSGETTSEEYKELWETITSGKEWRGEFHNVKKNGELYWEFASISPIRNDKGIITHFLAVKEDISERKRAEDLLHESEERYKLITQNTLDVVFMIDKTGKQLFFNESVEKILGYKQEELIGKSFTCFVPKSEMPKYQLQLKKIFLKKEISNFTTKVYHKNGDLTDVEINGKLLKYSGKLVALGTIRDISTRVKNELKIHQQNKELTIINSEKDKFFSIIAHDLKSPFNSIIGFSDLLVEQVRNNECEGIDKYAEIIKLSSNKAMDLLMNLMQWSQSQTGRMEFNPEYFELLELINGIELLLGGAIEQKSISILKRAPSRVAVFADKKMIDTVLRNLISNAIKFTYPGGKITVSVEEKQNELLVSVSDTGVGISKANCEKLFKIDQTYSTTGTNKEKGTGLGLILCKEFVEKHGGKIWVESMEKRGSTFYFTLPS